MVSRKFESIEICIYYHCQFIYFIRGKYIWFLGSILKSGSPGSKNVWPLVTKKKKRRCGPSNIPSPSLCYHCTRCSSCPSRCYKLHFVLPELRDSDYRKGADCSSGGIWSCRRCGLDFWDSEADPHDLVRLIDVLFDSEAYPPDPAWLMNVLFE